MSLIQAALNKTASVQPGAPIAPAVPKLKPESPVQHFPATPKPASAPRIWPPNLLDQGLESELTAIQRRYNARRLFWWKTGAGIALLLAVAGGIFFMGRSNARTVKSPLGVQAPMLKSVPPKAPVPMEVFAAVPVYRLSGITDFGSERRAIINGRIVAVGDKIAGQVSVKEIRQRDVILTMSGKEVLLNMQ